MKKLFYLLILILALGLGLWLFAPVERVYALFADRLQPVQASQLHGSLYKGRAGQLKWVNIDLGQLQWDKQWPTVNGGIQGRYRLQNSRLDLAGQLTVDKKHGFRASNLHGTLAWEALASFLHLPPGRLQALPTLRLDSLQYGPTGMQQVEGRIRLKDLGLVNPLQKSLGDIWVDIETQRSGLAVGTVHSVSSVLNASGVLYLHPHRFELNLVLKPKPGEYELRMALQSIGQPVSGGGRKIQVAGFY